MDRNEYLEFVNKLQLDNDVFPSDLQDCREDNQKAIENIQSIFDLKTKDDYLYLFAVIELLSDSELVDKIKNNLLIENGNKFQLNEIGIPNWKMKTLILTAFEDNIIFFSMAYNWISLCEYIVQNDKKINSVPEKTFVIMYITKNESYMRETSVMKMKAAAKAGPSAFGEPVKIEDLGTVYVQAEKNKTGKYDVSMYLLLDEQNKNTDVKLEITFLNVKDNKEYILDVIHNIGKSVISDQIFDIDISDGIIIKKIQIM